MSKFTPRIFPEIMNDMMVRLTSVTPVSDVNFGSIFSTMLEAAAQEDDEQYFQMLEIVRGYSLDTTTGADLDLRAAEYGLSRQQAKKASTFLTLGDKAVTKISTGVYSGLPGPSALSMSVNGDSSAGFAASGFIIVGRGTPNSEKKPYSSITNNGNYVTFNLSSALAFDHGTDETIIYAQAGDRTFLSGTVVSVPASDVSTRIDFTLSANAILLDGEKEVEGIPVTASQAGSSGNVSVGSITSFSSLPFSTATARNPQRVTNGKDIESDQELRDRIKSTIQSLSRGTAKAIITSIIGVTSETENRRVVSAALIEPTTPADVVKLYIDDGTGLIPNYLDVGYEVLVASATGGEKYVRIGNVPVLKAFVETQSIATWNLVGGETLTVDVGGKTETITFASTDFVFPGKATAQEVLRKLNGSASLFESRVSSAGTKVRIFSRANFDEQIRVSGGTANNILLFPTDIKYTTKLYITRNNKVIPLTKDGTTASAESGLAAGYNMGLPHTFVMTVDGIEASQLAYLTPGLFINPASVAAREIVSALGARLAGVGLITSSGDTKFRISSNTKLSSASKISIADTFKFVFTQAGISFTNQSVAATGNPLAPFQVLQSVNDAIYVGHDKIKFGSIYTTLSVVGSSDAGIMLQYWNGSAWTALGFNDSSVGLTQARGFISFAIPYDWAKVSTNSSIPAYWVRIIRTAATLATLPTVSRMKICSANEIFGFAEGEITGTEKDYTLNRFIGQIELVSTLKSKDKLSLGTPDTRAQVVTGTQGPFALFGGEVLTIVASGLSQSFTFLSGDFVTPGAATAQEVVTKITANIVGATASVVDTSKVKIRVNGMTGALQVVAGTTANAVLQFETDSKVSLDSHIPSVLAQVNGPYAFPVNSSLIIVMDGNLSNSFTVPLFKKGVATAASTTTITDPTFTTIFPNNSDLAQFDVEMIDGTQVGQRRSVTYNASTGQFTFGFALPGAPLAGDRFQVIPKTATQIVRFLNNRLVTLISTRAEISVVAAKVQIASLNMGEKASVLVSGGSANAILQFPSSEKIGVDGYRHFTGLPQQVQWTVDGVDGNDSYPGMRAAGVQVEVIEPVAVPIRIETVVTTNAGVSLSSISNDIRSAVSAYINTLPVGGDVILSEIIVAVKSVNGVSDVKISSPSANIPIADNELGRITDTDIIVG